MGAAGWYPTPEDPRRERFWDGSTFTGQVRAVSGLLLPPPIVTLAEQRAPVLASPPQPTRSTVRSMVVLVLWLAAIVGLTVKLFSGQTAEVPPQRPATPPSLVAPEPLRLPAVGGGDTVTCRDGSVSHAGGKQGACSHHGGER